MPTPTLSARLLTASEIEFVSDGAVTFELQASDEGRLLIFRNAILARAETNKNHDEILPAEIDNLAATIAGCPIDLEHRPDINLGVFTAGRNIDTPLGPALAVDGLIWADRYPAEAQGVRNGSHQLSIEAACERVECSKCGQMFAGRDAYCEHLKAKRQHGATRRAFGLKAVGGAVTQRPAGTATQFDRSQLWLVASHAEKEEPLMECPRCHKVSATEGDCSHCGKSMSPAVIARELDEALAKLTTAQTQIAAAQNLAASLEIAQTAQATAEQAAITAREAEQAALAARQAAEQKLAEAQAQVRRQVLGARMDDTAWEAKKDLVMAMTEDQFELFLGAFAPSPAAAGVRLPTALKQGQTPVSLG